MIKQGKMSILFFFRQLKKKNYHAAQHIQKVFPIKLPYVS